MSRVAPYIPAKQSLFKSWLQNFSGLITANPSWYGLVAADATAIAAQYTAFAAALALAVSPATKTPATVAAKVAAYINAVTIARGYAIQISLNAGVSSANKLAIGVNARTSVPAPITAPVSNPVLHILGQTSTQIALNYRDSAASPTSKSKPYGATQCEMWYHIGQTAVAGTANLEKKAVATKTPFVLAIPGGSSGLFLTFAARWLTQTGLTSPWSPVYSCGLM